MKSRNKVSSIATYGLYGSLGYLGWRALPHLSDILTSSVRVPFNIAWNLVSTVDLATSDAVLDKAFIAILAVSFLIEGVIRIKESCMKDAEEQAPKLAKLS